MADRPSTFRLNASHQLADSLWFAGMSPQSLSGSTYYHDSSPRGNHGTQYLMTAADELWDNQLGRLVNVFGVNNKYIATPSIAHGIGTGDFSVSWWAYSTSTLGLAFWTFGSYSPCFAKTPTTNVYYLYWNNSHTFLQAATIDGWDHLSFVRKSGTGYFYKNGVLDGQTRAVAQSLATSSFQIGRDGSSYYYRGRQCDHLFHARALSQAEINILADPSNVMLGGMLLPPKRTLWQGATVSGGGSGGATVNIGTVSVAATLSEPAVVLTTKSVEIGTVNGATSVSDPTVVKTTKSVEIGAVSVATSVSDPSVSTGGTVSVNIGTVSVAATLSEPTVVLTTKSVETGTVSVATSVSDPSVTGGGSVAINIGTISVAATVSDPTVSLTTKTVDIGTVSVATSVSDPTVILTSKTVDVGAVSVATSVADPSVTSGGSIAVHIGTVSVGLSVSDPTVVLGSVTVNDLRVSVAVTVSDPLLLSVPIHASRLHRVKYESRIHRILES